ncbi:sensor histidine kinase, partial [Flavobacterium sp.]|uniref:tetratricopeptide repeat-containing sensor histidine kinase n=1 Tax=Flavobacterium sp. TaxID=239 RepID=UPI00260D0B27
LLSDEKNNRKKATTYLQEFLDYALQKKDYLLIAKAYSTWAAIIMEEEPLESLKLFKKSQFFSEKIQNFAQLENLYNNMGVLYNEMIPKPDSAIYYLDKALYYGKKTNHLEGICHVLANKAASYRYKKEYQKAVQFLEEANQIETPNPNKSLKGFIQEFLALNYFELGEYKKAFTYLNESTKTIAEFNFEQQNIKISEFNIKYETQEKEIENLTLKSKIQQNQIITYAALILLFIVVILTVLIYKNLSKKKKIAEQERLIQTQKLEKTLKDRELHDIDLMLESHERERQQIANELHDNLGSLLATLKLNFQNLSRYQNHENKSLFDKTDALLEETYQKVRNISHLKNLGVVGSDGLVVAVNKMAEKMTVINRLNINVIPHGLTERLANLTEITLFRIIQELCTNIIKHSEASEVNIYLTQHNNNLINVIIEDNGKGFDYKKVTKKDGIGLKTIEQKVEQMGGTFTVDSVISKGTTIVIDIPL